MSDAFDGLSRLVQHRVVYGIFGDQVAGGIHALSIKTEPREEPITEETQIREAIQQAIDEHELILFMKGTPEQPACGFSARTVAALQALGAPFAAVDILPDPRIRQELSAISDWPTIPQLFVHGQLTGGCDIVTEMYESGELAQAPRVRPDDSG